MRSDPRPIFEPDPARMIGQTIRTTVRDLPRREDVMDAIMSALRDAQIENNRVAAILIGGRWFAAIDGRESVFLREDDIRIFCDSEMERGVRLVYDRGDAFNRWIAKCVAIDDKVPPTAMSDLAKRAPTDDAAMAVLTDWLEESGAQEDARALRAFQHGRRVLERLTATQRHGGDQT